MKNLILLSIIFIFTSCISERKIVINELCREIETPLNGQKTDSIFVLDKSCSNYQNFIKSYLSAKKKSEKFNNDGDFYWDKKYRWHINTEDINYFEKKIANQNVIKLKKQYFKGSRIILVSPNNKNIITSNNNDGIAINSGKYTYCITTPVFNKHKNIAIISLKTIVPNNIQFQNNKTIIFKKENSKWIKICEIKSTIE